MLAPMAGAAPDHGVSLISLDQQLKLTGLGEAYLQWFDSNAEVRQVFSSVAHMLGSLVVNTFGCGSNKQGLVKEYESCLNSTGDTSGSCGICDTFDCLAVLKVGEVVAAVVVVQ